MDSLEMQKENSPRGTIIRLIGDASVEHVDLLQRHLDSLKNLPKGLVVIDMAKLSYIGSIGLGMLIQFHNRVEANKSELRLAGMDASIMEAIHTARLDQVLKIFPTVDAALNAK